MWLNKFSGFRLKARVLIRWFWMPGVIHTQLRQESMDRLRRDARYDDPKCLVQFGFKIYSQNDEDGIISEIFKRIGTTNRIFLEFGVGNGLENNTFALLFQGWSGLWIDAEKELVEQIRTNLPRTISAGDLSIIHSLVTCENINALISSAIMEREIDLLSVDIDGNDFHVLDAINVISPRVIVVEYNAKFPPPIKFCIDYDPFHTSKADDCFGASLSFFEEGLARKGYRLVGCNLTGSNAFFVRSDLVADKFLAPFSAATHFQPPRYYLAEIPTGHNPSFDTLEKSSNARRTSPALPGDHNTDKVIKG